MLKAKKQHKTLFQGFIKLVTFSAIFGAVILCFFSFSIYRFLSSISSLHPFPYLIQFVHVLLIKKKEEKDTLYFILRNLSNRNVSEWSISLKAKKKNCFYLQEVNAYIKLMNKIKIGSFDHLNSLDLSTRL